VDQTKNKKEILKYEQLEGDVELPQRNIITQHDSQVSFMQYVPAYITKENKAGNIIGSDIVIDKQFKLNKVKKKMSNCSLHGEI